MLKRNDQISLLKSRVYRKHKERPQCLLSVIYNADKRPTNGRWINRDPIGEMVGGFNLYRFVQNKPIWKTDYLGQKECNEDTYMHFQNLRFTIELTTALQSTIKISDPETEVLDTLDAVVGGKFVNALAGGVGLTQELEAVKKNKLDENFFRLLIETMSSAGGMLAKIKMNISAEYCCYCCDGGEGTYRWQLTRGRYIKSSLLINLKGPEGLAQASEEFILAMTQVAEDIKNNACTES